MMNLIRSDWSDPRGGANTVAGRSQYTPLENQNKALTAFLRASSAKPFAWGEHDCLVWLADWIMSQTGRDAASEWRGNYASEFGAGRIVARYDGMIGLMDTGMSQIGVERTAGPRRGDVAIVEGAEGPTGAIITGAYSASLGQRGMFVRRAPILAAWSVPCRL